MRARYLLGLLLLLALRGAAQSGGAFTAARSLAPVSSGGSIQVRAAVVAPDGGLYVTGSFMGSASFGATTLTAVAGNEGDLFVARLDAAGAYQWAVRAGGARAETGTGLALDGSGNVVVVGEFTSAQAVFGPTTLTHPACNGCPMVFVAKLSATGAWQWVRQSTETSTSGYDAATGVATDAAGDVYVTGTFQRRNLVLGAYTLTHSQSASMTMTSTAPDDLFVAKLSAAGTWQWAVGGGGGGADRSTGVALDANRNVYVAGYFDGGNPTFGPTTLTRDGIANSLVLKLNSDGSWLRVTPGGNGYAPAYGLAVTAGGEVYIGGTFSQATTLGPVTLLATGLRDAYVARLSAGGTWDWARRSGGPGYDELRSLATDAAGNVYVTGHFDSGVFDAGSTTLTNFAAGTPDVLVARLDAQGAWQWALSAGGSEPETARVVAPDNQGGLYLLGNYESQFAVFGGYGLLGSGGQYSLLSYLARLSGATLASRASQPGSAFALYPNPSAGPVWAPRLPADQLVELYTLAGQLVGTARVPTQPTTALPLPAALPPGLYLARCGSQVARLEIR